MRAAFIKPPIGGIIGLEMLTFVEPLGLECVAAALEQDGHECLILDLRIDSYERGIEKLDAFGPNMIGVQCNFTTERNRAIRLTRALRDRYADALLAIGGHDASRDPEWFTDPSIDVITVGDGEEIVPALADAMIRGGDLSKTPGLVLNTPEGQVSTGPAPARRNIDELPLPARHLIKEYAPEYYINFRKPLALMETARGCPFKCNFCSVWKFHESTFREKSPERVVEELGQIEAPNVFITDDIFWMNVHRGREMAKQIKASGIKKYFTVQTRTDIICKFPELIEMWKDCGDLAIFLGVEKVDDAGLASVNKSNKAANNERAIEILKDLGVGFTCNFIVDPDWDRDDFTRLKEWIARMGAYNSGFTVLTPLPGTDLWDEVSTDVVAEDWEMFDIIHTVLPTKLPLEEFYQEFSDLWKWVLEVRYKERGKAQTYLNMLGALASGKVSLGAIRKGMNIAKVFSKPQTFLDAHQSRGA